LPTPSGDTDGTDSASGGTGQSDSDASAGTESSASGSAGDVRFDVGPPDVALGCGGGGGGGGGGDISFSYIWIANSSQGTMSKIDTQTLVEEGRYLVSPSGNGLPSRTSVNLSGDVAVANRTGGVTKVYAREADCQDTNGTPGIQTSTGPNDILAWGEEECIAWYTAMTYGSQRPIAWTQGTYNDAACRWEDQKIWTTGTTTPGIVDVMLLDGDSGVVEDMITINNLGSGDTYGGYGAVVDQDGNLWFNQMWVFGDALIRVDLTDLSYQVIPTGGRSGYGIARDLDGNIWTCGSNAVNRYDPVAGSWTSAALTGLNYGGCMVDGDGVLWVSGNNSSPYSIRGFDTTTVTQVANHSLPEHVHGVSIDFQGYVWGVAGTPAAETGQRAYRIDPVTGAYDTVEGLVGAYTYSDMTGFALVGATPPEG
jgi:hypothetical protein